ncbi:pseudouridine kinase [Marininema mesophilum]|uniref:Pseudouridine kinase n=1 Tax=Marininema mesophilum TaxID=1048340 RepID=A0A1H2Y1S1_9BACL|nr:PfkB family carbohydrate kinase [Marininema mesophilum]SDW98748.1 pseudouridine kinase [Marininema mesophilum]
MDPKGKDKERFILDKIRQNPFISQQDLADQLSISRSAVAGMIAGLVKQGLILGRAYVLADKERVVCIGGANIDQKARMDGLLEMRTSNPVSVSRSFGGVARNVAESLSQFEIPSALMTIVGEDDDGRAMLEDCGRRGVDISLCREVAGYRTGNYTAVLDPAGEMLLALADMEIYEKMSISMIEASWFKIRSSEMVVVDTNLPREVLHWIICQGESESMKLCLLPVSVPKAKRLPKDLSGVDLLIGNKDEIGVIVDQEVVSKAEAERACQRLIDQGVTKAVVTLGAEGTVFQEAGGTVGWVPAGKAKVIDVTGAGDAFATGVITGLCRGTGLAEACQLGASLAKATLEVEMSVVAMMTTDGLLKRWEEEYRV